MMSGVPRQRGAEPNNHRRQGKRGGGICGSDLFGLGGDLICLLACLLHNATSQSTAEDTKADRTEQTATAAAERSGGEPCAHREDSIGRE